jgi:acyl carrier protein
VSGVSSEEIEDRVRRVLAEVLDLDPSDVSPETSKGTVQAWSSLQHLTVVLSLEEEFELQFDEEETLAIVSFPLIVTAVTEHLGVAQVH